jgi:hypothetical protein
MQDILFYRNGELRNYLEKGKIEVKKEIESYESNYILNASEEELVRYLVNKYSLEPPVLNQDKKYVYDQSEADIDVSRDPMRAFFEDEPFHVKGISVTIAIPFDGDGNLFRYKPATYTLNPPRGDVEEQEVHLIYERAEHDAEELNRTIKRDIERINEYLSWVKRDVEAFNKSLEPFIREAIKRREEKLLKDLDVVRKLDIPIKRREDLPKTYSIPEIRRKPKIEKPRGVEKMFQLEPSLEMKEYENILDILRNMVLVMERSPKAFANMNEEDIRQHFLVQLNAQYEGMATGESFNYEGKTDILIRYEGKNVFIAECKFWEGEKGLSEAIDQLLGYTSWRDTKTAILLFNRRKNFSNVLEKIPAVVVSHKCFKRELEKKGETEFRCIFHQPDDPNRELVLTIMAFDVPG